MRCSALGLLASLFLATAAAATSSAVWLIGPRTLPAPAGASEELRGTISASPAPDVKAALADVPTSLEEWQRRIAEVDAGWAASTKQSAAQLGVTIREDRIAGIRVYRITPARIHPRHARHLFVHVHGGGFLYGAGLAGAGDAVLLAARLGIPALMIDYRMAPSHPAPAAMDDIVAVWRALLETRSAGTMALGGSSAGGNLTLVAAVRMKQLGLALPAALFVGTPVVDLRKRGDTRFLNEGVDRILVAWGGEISPMMALYAGGRRFEDPLLSPIFAEVEDLPPSYLISGTRDLFLSDTVRMHRALRRAGVEAELHVYEGLSHAEYALLADTPESAEHHAELQGFLLRHLD